MGLATRENREYFQKGIVFVGENAGWTMMWINHKKRFFLLLIGETNIGIDTFFYYIVIRVLMCGF